MRAVVAGAGFFRWVFNPPPRRTYPSGSWYMPCSFSASTTSFGM